MSANNLFSNSNNTTASSGISGITNDLSGAINSIDSMALPIEQGIGNFSQIYTQVKQLNPQAQTSIPVNEVFYQAPQNSLTGNFAEAVGGVFNQTPAYIWWILGAGGVGFVIYAIASAKKR